MTTVVDTPATATIPATAAASTCRRCKTPPDLPPQVARRASGWSSDPYPIAQVGNMAPGAVSSPVLWPTASAETLGPRIAAMAHRAPSGSPARARRPPRSDGAVDRAPAVASACPPSTSAMTVLSRRMTVTPSAKAEAFLGARMGVPAVGSTRAREGHWLRHGWQTAGQYGRAPLGDPFPTVRDDRRQGVESIGIPT